MGGEFPLWSMVSMAEEGREPLRDWISLSVLFCFVFFRSGPSPFLIFPEIRNSNCAEILTRFFSINYLSCARRRAPTDLRGGHKTPGRARGCLARPGGLWALWAPICVDSTSQKSHIVQIKSS